MEVTACINNILQPQLGYFFSNAYLKYDVTVPTDIIVML